MEDKDILDKLNKENSKFVPDVRDKVVTRAKAEGLFELVEEDSEVSNGNTVAAAKRNFRIAGIAILSLVVAVCLLIAIPIALSKSPVSDLPDDFADAPVFEEMGDDYSVGAVGTVKLMEQYADSIQPATAKAVVAKRSAESGIENFGIYFSAFDTFFSKDMLKTTYAPHTDERYNKIARISGRYPDGAAADFIMYYCEALDIDTSSSGAYNYYLEGYITLGYNQYALTGWRTVTVNGGKQTQTGLEICAYPSVNDKTTYAKMQLTDDGYKFTVVIGGATESEALLYKSADMANSAYVVEIAGADGGSFTVGMPAGGRGEVSVDYVCGDNKGQFIVNTSENDYSFVHCDYLLYQVSGDECYVSGYDADKLPSDGKVVIPAYVGGKPVTQIAKEAFYKSGDNSVKSVVIPDSVKTIGSYAFRDCGALTEVVLPSDLKELANGVFLKCTSLESINLPDGIERINTEAFWLDEALADFNFPANLTYIGQDAFYGCAGLENLNIPESVKTIGEAAFSSWTNLKTVTVAPANNYFKASGNCLIDNNGLLIVGCANSVIPSDGSVKAIGAYAFVYSDIASISFPASVETIGNYAFAYSGLTSVSIPATVKTVGKCAFTRCAELNDITLPDTDIVLEEDAFAYCAYYYDTSKREDGALYIGKHLIFVYKLDLEGELRIKSGTLTIVPGAIENCIVKRIVLNSELLYISKGVMYGTTTDEIAIDGVNSRYVVKDNCLIDTQTGTLIAAGANSVIPDDGSVTTIGTCAFCGYKNQTLVIPASVRKIESYAFATGYGYTEIVINAPFVEVETEAFGCDVKCLRFNGEVRFAEYAISGCVYLEEVYLGGSIPVNNMFRGCPAIKDIYVVCTIEMWYDLTSQAPQWYDPTADFTVHCADGDIDKWGY